MSEWICPIVNINLARDRCGELEVRETSGMTRDLSTRDTTDRRKGKESSGKPVQLATYQTSELPVLRFRGEKPPMIATEAGIGFETVSDSRDCKKKRDFEQLKHAWRLEMRADETDSEISRSSKAAGAQPRPDAHRLKGGKIIHYQVIVGQGLDSEDSAPGESTSRFGRGFLVPYTTSGGEWRRSEVIIPRPKMHGIFGYETMQLQYSAVTQ
ncbi:hypothetical protein B0H14DRAFT_2592840 [Mycena olivaceomarginata]|nr:hypothetical protein B0H14DRAFT_2592840 [Mycena olivaceomarginata]